MVKRGIAIEDADLKDFVDKLLNPNVRKEELLNHTVTKILIRVATKKPRTFKKEEKKESEWENFWKQTK